MTWWDWFVPEAQRPEPQRDVLFEAQVDELKRARERAETRVQALEGLLREALPLIRLPYMTIRRADLMERIEDVLATAQVDPADLRVVRLVQRLRALAIATHDSIALLVCQEALEGDDEARKELEKLCAERGIS